MERRRAWLYCRVGNGWDADATDYLNLQKTQLEQFCQEHGLTIAGSAIVTGNGKREIRELVQSGIERNSFDVLAVLSIWVDGINSLFTVEKLLLGGTRFEKIYAFEHDGLTNLLFPFSGEVKLNMGKLVMWRLQTHENFGGTWLSDYVPNRLQVPGLPDVPGIRRLWLFPHRPGPQGVWPIHQGQ